MHILETIWYISFVVLIGYHMLIFRARDKRTAPYQPDELPGVSIVIAVKNGSDHLIRNLGAFLSQDYPTFEVIIVDDHSDLGEKDKLEEVVSNHPRVSLFHSDQSPGKKYALTQGIQMANNDLILCTDADCIPAGHGWITSMVSQSSGQNLVLGYSPYKHAGGLLNLLIRFETVMTGIQYLSWAIKGKPYMGVGRNILYPRSLFLEANPYQGHEGIPYGDDDLWVQQASSLTRVNVNFEKAAHVYSDPPISWRQWIKQKHRHLSAGHHYSNASWWQPGIYGMALIMHWFLLPLFLPIAFDSLMFTLLVVGLAVRWDTYRRWTRQLGDMDTAWWYPLLDIGYAVYLAGMGIFTAAVKKKTWN